MEDKLIFDFPPDLVDVSGWKEPEPPEGGWKEVTCSYESHKWQIELDGGHFYVQCVDPCPDPEHYDSSKGLPACIAHQHYGESADFCTPDPLPIRLKFIDESTPDSWMGPAEYGFYIEVYPRVSAEQLEAEFEAIFSDDDMPCRRDYEQIAARLSGDTDV